MEVKQSKQDSPKYRIEDPLEEMESIAALLRSKKFLVMDPKGPSEHYQDYIPDRLEEGVRLHITTHAIPELQKIQTQMYAAKLQIVPGKKKNGSPEEEAKRIEVLLSDGLLSHLREALNPNRVRPRSPQRKKKSATAKQHDVYFDFSGIGTGVEE